MKAFRTQLAAIKRWGRSTPVDLSTITQPTLFRSYLLEQIRQLIRNHSLPIEAGPSPQAVIATDEFVWVADGEDNTVTKIDPGD